MTNTLATSAFWGAVLERAIKTAAQTAIPLVTASASGLLGLDWQAVLSLTAAATLLSVLTSIGSANIGSPGPSVLAETVTTNTTVAASSAPADPPSDPPAGDASTPPTSPAQ